MSYYFEVRIIFPEDEQTEFLDRKLSKSELSEVTHYLRHKTSRGIPVKFRVGIFSTKDNIKIMSVTLNTKHTKETDVINALINRVTDQDVLVYLNQKTDKEKESEKQETKLVKQPNQSLENTSNVTNKTVLLNEKKESVPLNNLPKKLNKNSGFSFIVAFFIVLLIGVTIYQQVQLQSVKKESKSLEEKIERVKETDISQSKIDTFGRYFLTYYFAQENNKENYQSNVKNYLSKELNISDWKQQGKKLKSVNYYGSEPTKKGYSVTYLLIVEVEERSKMQSITFNVEETENSFLVTNQPTLKDFSFN